tara:strand:+ start:97 stop:516 length:420 start_codon:yes stop_codon:yes gene_type:complete
MHQNEFIEKIIGKPWVNRASSFDGADCWGVVVLYYKHVLNIDIPTVQGFIENDQFEKCYSENLHLWEEVKSAVVAGLVFTCYKGKSPSHVGVCIGGGKVLHSRGTEDNHGKVEIHSIRAIEAVYGKITLHKFIGQQLNA